MSLRIIYYDKETGNILSHCLYKEDIQSEPTFDQDYNTMIDLKSRTKESIGELRFRKGEYAHDFAEGKLIGVNLETKEPIFSYHNPSDPANPIIPEKPLTEQIAELKQENENLTLTIDSILTEIIPSLFV